MRRNGFTLLEIVIGLAVLAALSVPLFQMFSGQRQEIAWTNREALLQTHAVALLSEEEARLVRENFQDPETTRTRTVRVGEAGEGLSVEESFSVKATPQVTGAYRLDVMLTWKDVRAGVQKQLKRTKLVVDREESPLAPVRMPPQQVGP